MNTSPIYCLRSLLQLSLKALSPSPSPCHLPLSLSPHIYAIRVSFYAISSFPLFQRFQNCNTANILYHCPSFIHYHFTFQLNLHCVCLCTRACVSSVSSPDNQNVDFSVLWVSRVMRHKKILIKSVQSMAMPSA